MARMLSISALSIAPAHKAVLMQFLRFGVVGTISFMIDTATVYALRASLGVYGAAMVSYLVAASTGWLLNRVFTFRHRGGALHRQWALFVVTNLAGFIPNRGTYALLVHFVPFCATHLVVPVGAGALAGMFVNFTMARRVIFR